MRFDNDNYHKKLNILNYGCGGFTQFVGADGGGVA